MTSDSTSASNTTQQVTVIAPINIALIKYWGKRDEDLVLPLNDSVSLNVDDLYAKTRIRTGASIHEDSVAVNGRAVDLSKPNRFSSCFAEVRRISRKRLMNDDGDTQENPACFQKFEASFSTVLLQATVVSETNFPVEAGLASSAAGFAAVAFALGHLYKLKNDEIIRIARLGSGSACRSMLGGFVHWKAGTRVDGSDCCCEVVSETNFPVEAGLASSAAGFAAVAFALGHLYKLKNDEVIRIARLGKWCCACRSMLGGFVHWKAGTRVDGSDCCCEVVAPAEHWSTLCAIIVVTSRDSKHTSSTDGMRRSVQTSQLLSFRAKEVVPGRVSRLLKAIASKDFEQLATITMSESNQLHAICMDTMPPLKYMNGNSWRLVRLVEALNAHSGCKRVAYTFDAGPNCCLFVETHFVPTVVSETNFPVEAGLASSAAGFAAVAFALGHLYKLKNDEVVAPAEHWSTLCAIIVVTSRDSKHTSSTDGMRRSVQTSQLLSFRAKEVVPGRVSRLLKAIASKDFEQLATITMSESNQLHAICMDTMPPLKYMNGNSWRLVRLVEALNAHSGCKRVAYTFDAGPNCCLFVETHFVPTVFAALLRYCHLPTALFDKLGASSAGREWPQLRETAENLQKNVTLNGVEPAENVVSETNFPVEAGLASSAAGFAAVAFALGHLYKLKNDEVVAPAEHWSTLCAIIVVTSRDSKHTSSTDGMRRSVQTSQLLSFRAKEVVPGRVSRLLKAIASKDFEQLATITMSESNQLHAICMDTMPPLKYMNGNSWRLVRLVEALNAHSGCKRVAYTFDAGPNCCLFVETHFVPTVFAALLRYCHLPTALFDKLGASSAGREWPQLRETAENLQKNVTLNGVEPAENVVHDIFLSHVGGQPTVVL
ncbi:Diphosphomevalonate decarboxylase [Toxocara canis]|uniref:Diphosphomevalonate decarboxylase n=1 Tax=Toxocara canis TaxID=6265 RepID=A0A0B2V2I0_TOXCA|nr:Diphosphomevalonate decarboxylase [Toxocara canis]